MGAPGGIPSIASSSPPSSNGDEPLKILDKPELSAVNVHCCMIPQKTISDFIYHLLGIGSSIDPLLLPI